jgi:hypothetical protein
MKKHFKLLGILIVILVLLVLIIPRTQKHDVVSVPRLTLEQIQNASILNPFDQKTIQLRGGKYSGELLIGKGNERGDWVKEDFEIMTEPNSYSESDYNNDGAEDMFVVVNSFAGGTGYFFDLLAFKNVNGTPVFSGSTSLGDRISINKISAVGNVITADIITQGPTEGMCCGTMRQIRKYTFDGSKFTENK